MSRASRFRSTGAYCVTVCCHTEGLSAGGLARDLNTEPPRHCLCVTVFSCRFFLPFCHRPFPYGSNRVHFKLQYFVYYGKLISARDFKINCSSEDRHGVLGAWWCVRGSVRRPSGARAGMTCGKGAVWCPWRLAWLLLSVLPRLPCLPLLRLCRGGCHRLPRTFCKDASKSEACAAQR